MTKSISMKITKIHITKLKPCEYNPRAISKHDFNQLKKSVERFGFVDPLIINSNPKRKGIIIGGHMRHKVAIALKIKEIPCIEINLSEAKEQELNIRLNRNKGEFDWDKLANIYDQKDLKEYGFTNFELSFFDLSEPQNKKESITLTTTFKMDEMSSFEALKQYIKDKGYNYKVKMS